MALTKVKSAQEIESMRAGGKILAGLLNFAEGLVKPGVSTKEVADQLAVEINNQGVTSAFLGFGGFPDVVCISLNDEVVHGIPSKSRVVKEGDLVSVDLGIRHQGLITDSARTIYVGENPPKDIQRLLNGTKLALESAINSIKGPTKVGDIANAIQSVLDDHDLGIVRDLVGHGVGHGVHEDPNIPNYGNKGTGPLLQPGMTVAIEPMATLGGWQVDIKSDGWTVATRDGSLSAQFEHTVLITDGPAEILTL